MGPDSTVKKFEYFFLMTKFVEKARNIISLIKPLAIKIE